MDECFRCGIEGNVVRLFDAISNEGIVKVCEQCAREADIPVVRKPTTFQLKESERKPTVYERLSRVAGIPVGNYEEEKKRKEQLLKQEANLRDLLDKTFQKKKQDFIKKNSVPREDLIDNFHWVLLMARRKKHLSQRQVAHSIGESEIVLKMAEQGNLPEDDNILINKLERFFDIVLRKKSQTNYSRVSSGEKRVEAPARILDFNPAFVEKLTIADLKKLKEEKEKANLEKKEEPLEKSAKNKNDDISQEEIDRIIFGSKS